MDGVGRGTKPEVAAIQTRNRGRERTEAAGAFRLFLKKATIGQCVCFSAREHGRASPAGPFTLLLESRTVARLFVVKVAEWFIFLLAAAGPPRGRGENKGVDFAKSEPTKTDRFSRCVC